MAFDCYRLMHGCRAYDEQQSTWMPPASAAESSDVWEQLVMEVIMSSIALQ